jgi:hypothetical protein
MSLPIVQRLRDAAVGLRDERVSMQVMAQAHGPEAQGALLLLLAIACLLPVPGVGTVLGLGVGALSWAMWRGHAACLPKRVAELGIPLHWAQRILGVLACAYAIAGRHAKVRLTHFACAGRRSWVSATVGLMAVIIVMPIPFGNVLPAIALAFIGLGLVFQDGVAVTLGVVIAGLALCLTLGLVLLAWVWGSGWLLPWLAG